MRKDFLQEQLNRAEACALDEMIFHKENDNYNMWVQHEKGHLEIINLIRSWITHSDVIDVKKLKKLIQKRVKYNTDIIHQLDKKYNNFNDDEEMSEDDNFLYHLSDGMNCEAGVFLRILNKKYFYSKKAYEPTNWEEFLNP